MSSLGGAAAGIGTALSGIADFGNMIGNLLPTSQTQNFSGQTNKQTQQIKFDDVAIQRMLNLIMQDPATGLQATASGQKSAGVFDTTTNQLLVNNLLATAAGEVARLTAPTEVIAEMGPTRTKTKSSKCFITTAAVKYAGLEDNGFVLETLRGFRDTWVKENYPQDIEQYYSEAPAITEALEQREDAVEIFNYYYQKFILVAVSHIVHFQYEHAYKLYKKMFNAAKSLSGVGV